MGNVRIRVTRDVLNIFAEYRPVVGKEYDAKLCALAKYARSAEFVIVNILDKRIVLRKDGYEIVGV